MTQSRETQSPETQAPEAGGTALKRTALHDLHLRLGGKMVAFAGYDMPVQYPAGILHEHLHTRSGAGLFDVSHMGQAFVHAAGHERAAKALESVTPGNFMELGLGRVRYTLLMDESGGIRDDLMVTRSHQVDDDGRLYLVVNAACKDDDYRHLEASLPAGATLEVVEDRALLALQGPAAAAVLARHCPTAGDLSFMSARSTEIDTIDCHISRSGYTGEDGYEISVKADRAEDVATALLAEAEVEPIGLGARDSLRLEAGLCLYGHDIDRSTSPVEADLMFAVAKRRRQEGGFPGWDRLADELKTGPVRKRVGVLPVGRAPAREGTEIFSPDGQKIGVVTSGGFGPTLGAPVAMGYLEAGYWQLGTEVLLEIRGRRQPAKIAPMPFVPHNYYRKRSLA